MSTQPEALRLAEWMEWNDASMEVQNEAAEELRRLHAVNVDLLEFVKDFVNIIEKHGSIKGSEKTIAAIARAVIAKAEGGTNEL